MKSIVAILSTLFLLGISGCDDKTCSSEQETSPDVTVSDVSQDNGDTSADSTETAEDVGPVEDVPGDAEASD